MISVTSHTLKNVRTGAVITSRLNNNNKCFTSKLET